VALTSEDLRLRLGFKDEDWSTHDDVRADAVLASARTVIVTLAGPSEVAEAEVAENATKLGALDEATMVYAVPIFANPERVLQRRQGSDYSVSFSDGSEAVTGLREARAILSGAGFGASASAAFSVDTVSVTRFEEHAEWCSLNFGANYCSCGANLAGYPIFGEPA
jgi:hypothetical protein